MGVGLPEGSALQEGDVVLPEATLMNHERDFERDLDRAWRNRSLWPCGFFLFVIEPRLHT